MCAFIFFIRRRFVEINREPRRALKPLTAVVDGECRLIPYIGSDRNVINDDGRKEHKENARACVKCVAMLVCRRRYDVKLVFADVPVKVRGHRRATSTRRDTMDVVRMGCTATEEKTRAPHGKIEAQMLVERRAPAE